MTTNKVIYWTVVAQIVFNLLWLTYMDMVLWWNGRPTISEWLREEPWWYFCPLGLLTVCLYILTIHLFGK